MALAVSHSTAADASWLTAIEPSRIVTAHSGPSLCVGRHAHERPVERRPEVGLVVSTLEPRKNPEFLFHWFHTSNALPAKAELWWVGSIGWLTSRRDLKQFERRAGSSRRIRFLGVVSDAALCKLYRTAGWSIYPSLYEGFGFPVLDALRHGTPVLSSMNSSIREFDSPGLHLFDPCDPSTVDEAWTSLQARGAEVIPREPLDRLYSWDNVARDLPPLTPAPTWLPSGRLALAGRLIRRSRPCRSTNSRRILLRGQSFPQFLGRQFEELPEAQLGQLQTQQAVRRSISPGAGPEPTQIPVQPLQVE